MRSTRGTSIGPGRTPSWTRGQARGRRGSAFRIALKIAESRRIVRELGTPVTITLLNPVYKETGRMQRREDHPHGEDSIRCKVRVLRGLEALSPHLTARLVDNDADLSVHPAQLGILIEDILEGRAGAVAGSRREVDSVALIGPSRNTRGHLFIRIWQHLLPELARTITDTNRAFKAFESGALARILPRIETYTFPYQIELLQACITSGIPLTTRGMAYVGSEAASTQDGAEITENYLSQIIDIARRYGALDEEDELARFFLSVSEAEWQRIEADPPDSLAALLREAGGS